MELTAFLPNKAFMAAASSSIIFTGANTHTPSNFIVIMHWSSTLVDVQSPLLQPVACTNPQLLLLTLQSILELHTNSN
jgi:hypothetical protein